MIYYSKHWDDDNCQAKTFSERHYLSTSEADSGLVKLVVMTNVFFNYKQHEIKTKWFVCVKQIKASFPSNNEIQRFYS